MIFLDRVSAGKILAERLLKLSLSARPPVVLGIPRGGAVVAFEVAKALGVPLDVVVVRKLGVPLHKELAFGAIDLEGKTVLDRSLIRQLGIGPAEIETVREKEWAEARRREEIFRGKPRRPLDLKGKLAIIVDDGIATGETAEAAVNFVRSKGAETVILAAPVGSPETAARLRSIVEAMVILETPPDFLAVGQFYENFPQTSDEEVINLLRPVSGS